MRRLTQMFQSSYSDTMSRHTVSCLTSISEKMLERSSSDRSDSVPTRKSLPSFIPCPLSLCPVTT